MFNFDSHTLLILGLARQGTALAQVAAANGAQVVVSDLRSAEILQPLIDELAHLPIDFVLGEHPMSLLDGCDTVAVSGGVPLTAPIVVEAQRRGIRLTNDSLEFALRSPAPIIGITGSAGKSTTTALVGAMGEAAERPTWVGGNIGRPLITELDEMAANHIVVQELSSFQLDLWTTSPHIALLTNITPNHLDRHKTMAAYTAAKANILRYQTADDVAILPLGELEQLEPLVQGRLRHFSDRQAVTDGAFLRRDELVLRNDMQETVVCGVDEVRLIGAHNIKNVLAAIVAADSAELPIDAMREAIRTFDGLAHRLEFVATINGATYINDSIATSPERAMAALDAFEAPIILLAGGKDKAMVWEPWRDRVVAQAKATILFGDLAFPLGELLYGESCAYTRVRTMPQAVDMAHRLAEPGDVVLLAPGGTSFDAYTDFAERGSAFRDAVATLRNRPQPSLTGEIHA